MIVLYWRVRFFSSLFLSCLFLSVSPLVPHSIDFLCMPVCISLSVFITPSSSPRASSRKAASTSVGWIGRCWFFYPFIFFPQWVFLSFSSLFFFFLKQRSGASDNHHWCVLVRMSNKLNLHLWSHVGWCYLPICIAFPAETVTSCRVFSKGRFLREIGIVGRVIDFVHPAFPVPASHIGYFLMAHQAFFFPKKKKNADHGVLPEDEKKPSPRKQKPSSNSDAQSMWIPSSGAGTCVEYIAFPAKTGPSAWNFLRGQVYRARGTAGRAV